MNVKFADEEFDINKSDKPMTIHIMLPILNLYMYPDEYDLFVKTMLENMTCIPVSITSDFILDSRRGSVGTCSNAGKYANSLCFE